MSRKPIRKKEQGKAAFTLVELILVAAIIMIMMGLLAVSLTQTQGRSLQMASAQVASGMSMARQLAITKNTDALFIIARTNGSGASALYPEEAFRYWAVVYSNRDQSTWTFAKDWERLPPGAVFMTLVGEGYNPLGWSTDGTLPSPGTPFAPKIAPSGNGEWQYFNSFTNLSMVWPSGSGNLSGVPFIGFRSTGKAFIMRSSGTPISGMAVVLGEGTVSSSGEIVLQSSNNIFHVETDHRTGRVNVRPRESYTAPRKL